MNFDIDIAIFLGFLAVNLIVGLFASRGVNTVRGFAIGDKNFSTSTLVSTIVATWISGSFFCAIISEAYTKGVSFIFAVLGDALCLLFIGIVCAPRMAEFLSKLSIAEAMSDLFGKNVGIITAISGTIGVIGIISVQLKIAGLLFEYGLGIPGNYGIISAGLVVTLYSSMGGVRSVVLTDIMQFITFGAVIPSLAYFLFYSLSYDQEIMNTINNNPLFDYRLVFDLSSPGNYYTFFLFLFWLTPSFNPAIFQRIAMAKDVKQISYSFIISSIVSLLLIVVTCWIAILLVTVQPNLDKNDIFKFILVDSVWITGFKGIILAGIMAMIMSTVDSFINSSAVLLIHDLRKALNVGVIKNELFTTRLCSLSIGFTAILFTMFSGSFLQLFIWAMMFYMPVVTIPFIMAIFGFRSSSKSVLIAMAAGFTVAMIWELYFKKEMAGVDGVVPGMLANFIFLFGYHYLFKQHGGWIGIKDPEALAELKRKKKEKFNKLLNSIKFFSIWNTLKNNTPKSDGSIALLGLFVLISTFSAINTIPKDIHMQHAFLLNILYPLTLFGSSSLISYPLWSEQWKESNLLVILFNATIFFILISFSSLLVLISQFSEIPLIVFMVNLIVVGALCRWNLSIVNIILGISISLIFYKKYLNSYNLENEFNSMEFKLIYLVLLIIGAVVIFLKPKQEYLEATEAKVGTLKTEVTNLDYEVNNLNGKVTDLNHTVSHYSQRLSDQSKEIDRLGETGQRILNNVNHELRLPVGNVMNFAEMLNEGLEKFSPKQLKMISDEVYKNSTRLGSMILNMLDLATLEVKNVNLQKRTVNFSELVENRVKICRSIYLDNKPINFKLTIDPEILISVDPDYIRQTIDNLVINAINFSEEGTIEVIVKNQPKSVEFMITDEGIGIPEKDIYDIFTPFKMGSNTESKAQGRGVGLALCQSAIKAHDGSIEAKSKFKGATFIVILPK